jgi:hypothetical protein
MTYGRRFEWYPSPGESYGIEVSGCASLEEADRELASMFASTKYYERPRWWQWWRWKEKLPPCSQVNQSSEDRS